jgi:hypothetical protein
MKIDAQITGVNTDGDTLHVTAQGKIKDMAEWRRPLNISFDVPDENGTRKTYVVGRKLRIEFKSK